MVRKKRIFKLLLGLFVGYALSQFLSTGNNSCLSSTALKRSLKVISDEEARSSNKSLLFVGVMTAAKYLEDRAVAVYNTWGREVPGKVTFYSSEFSESDNVPLVALTDVDDSYPPQKKSFMMLKHIYDNYIDHYEWFLRADDDVYIRTDKLEKLLRSVDSRKAWFIGQTGRGNSEEFGQLSLDSDENFCMGGPGVIMSRETLKRIASHIDYCLQNLYTTHEDVELGRCVRKYAKISCTWSYEMQVIFYHNQSGEAAFTGDLKLKEVHRAITLHPVKKPKYMYRLHNYLKGLVIQNRQQESLLLHRDIAIAMEELGYRIDRLENALLAPNLPLFPYHRGSRYYLGDTKLLGVQTSLNRYTPHILEDVLEWEIISKTLYSHRDLNPRKRIGTCLKEGLGDVTREIMELINSFSKQRGRVIEFKEILYGYWRLDPIHGVDLILDLLLIYKKYRGRKMTVQVRRHAYVQQTFTGIFIKEVESYSSSTSQLLSTDPIPVHKKIVKQIFSKISENIQILNYFNTTNKPLINFLMPLSGRYNIFIRFLKMYEDICIKHQELTNLYIILYKNEESPEDFDKTIALIDDMNSQYRSNVITVVNTNDTFARGKALQHGVDLLKNDDLMLFIDVDIIFNEESLERIRRNTFQSKSVYFPIVYSLYNPKLLNKIYNSDYRQFQTKIINEKYGFWRQFGFGIVSLYKSDYIQLGGFNLQISGWGYEDVTFFDNVVKSDLKIVRTIDPNLIHVFHSVKCDISLEVEQLNMCLGTKASTLGNIRVLQKLYMKYQDLFR